MGQLFSGSGLTQASLIPPGGGSPQSMPSTAAAMDAANQALQQSGPAVSGDVLNPQTTSGQGLPMVSPKPSYAQAVSQVNPQTGMPLSPLQNPNLTKMGKLGAILSMAAQGGLAGRAAQEQMIAESGGRRSGGVGTGFTAGFQLPFLRQFQQNQATQGALQNRILGAQAQYYPQIMQLNAMKTGSEIGKNEAEASKAGAEASGQDYVNALHQAQTAAAKYKEVGGALYDVSGQTPQPVQGAAGAFIPADESMAALANVPVGTQLPIQIAQKLREMSQAGLEVTQANGRSILIDKTQGGKKIADLGTATPVVTMNMMNPFAGTQTPTVSGEGALASLNPQQASIVRGVANYTIDPDKLPLYRSPQAKFQLLSLVKAYNPNYDETRYQAKAAFMKSAIGGKIGDEINAYQTALAHADLLERVANALGNGDTRALNSLKNSWSTQFGSPLPTNYQTVANAYAREVTKALSAGHITNDEIGTQGKTIPQNASLQQILGTVDMYRQLMTSKMQQRQAQMDAAMQGNPNFGNPGGNNNSGPKKYWEQFPVHQ